MMTAYHHFGVINSIFAFLFIIHQVHCNVIEIDSQSANGNPQAIYARMLALEARLNALELDRQKRTFHPLIQTDSESSSSATLDDDISKEDVNDIPKRSGTASDYEEIQANADGNAILTGEGTTYETITSARPTRLPHPTGTILHLDSMPHEVPIEESRIANIELDIQQIKEKFKWTDFLLSRFQSELAQLRGDIDMGTSYKSMDDSEDGGSGERGEVLYAIDGRMLSNTYDSDRNINDLYNRITQLKTTVDIITSDMNMMNSSNIGKEITSRQNEKNMTERILQLELKNKQEKQARHQEQKLQNDKLLRIEDGLNRTRSLTEKWMLVSDAMKLSHIRLFSSLTDQMSILNSLETKFNKAALKLSNLQVEVMNITHNGLLSTAACNVTEMAIRSKIDLEKMQSLFENERYKVDSLILEVGKKADESTVRQLQLILASTNDKLEKFDSNLRNVIKKLNDSQSSLNNLEASLPKACSDSMTTYGVHKEYLLIKPSDKLPSQMVHCDKDWTIIQQRMDGAVRFNRTFEEYRWPFGNVDADHWIGNEYINALTQLCDCSIRFETWDVFGEYRLAIYHNFSVSDFDHLYRLSISNYDSNSSNLTDAMSFHDGRRFSSLDRDEDTSSTHCARYYAAGWWFANCVKTNLNGNFHLGILWFDMENGDWFHLDRTRISITKNAQCNNSVPSSNSKSDVTENTA